jgi:hypothetical protein
MGTGTGEYEQLRKGSWSQGEMQHTEEVQVHCRLGSMHLVTMLGVKVQSRLTQFPEEVQQLFQKNAKEVGPDLEISLFSEKKGLNFF